MADKDPWLGVDWKVYAAQGASGPDLKPSGKEGTFTLTAVPTSGPTSYYTATFVGDNMPVCWQGLLLYPHGTALFPPPAPLLQPWKASGDGPWLAAANAVRQGLNDSMARLEGVLHASGAHLTLVCVPNATTLGTPLLVMSLNAATTVDAAMPPNNIGTGHGDN